MTDAPPKPSHAGSLLATALLLVVWLTLTIASPWLAPWIAGVAEDVEVALGLDVLPGKPGATKDDGNGG